ncbi:MAG TPA: hypothetical protein H9784_10275 [Candidatus Desulfovibrio intestinavium]|uniref:Uncharacterized protein n=1 Tax=Candidatus Desulfovibrio intestinavium TaxID=2838534 RepID=A0A9D2HPQ4_9BACT|nr:hypothetical protein [Candidatus Desulfovibrio intestinavium]
MNTLSPKNENYGFYGTMSRNGCADTAWEIAMTLIAEDTGAEPEEVRAFLDSNWGRHFADTVYDCLDRYPLQRAIETAIEIWNGWKLSRRVRRELDIPTPMRYLAGMVYTAAIYADVI